MPHHHSSIFSVLVLGVTTLLTEKVEFLISAKARLSSTK